MPPFTVNPHRRDPYKQFKFRVVWDGRAVAGVSEVSPLVRTTEVVSYRDGNDPGSVRVSPGRTSFEPIVLARGITHDTEFERWANKAFRLGASAGAEVSLGDFRKDVVLQVLNEAGQVVLAYLVYRCWVSEYVAIAGLDADDGGLAFESITLQNEGWERDHAVTEPQEPTHEHPAPAKGSSAKKSA